MLVHVVARALPGYKPFVEPSAAWWLMWRLRRAFPSALAACVMPDHLHLVAPTADVDRPRRRVARILARLTVRVGRKALFERVPAPEPIANGKHLDRLARYVHLNPTRAGLVDDPLRWPWSTHRGLLGAELDPWVDVERLAQAVGRPARGFSQWLHEYVSSDPSVNVCGSPFPEACSAREVPAVALDAVRRAALTASPWSPPAARRRLIVALGRHQGWHDADLLARVLGVSSRSARRIIAETNGVAPARAALLCLGDARLLLDDAFIHPVAALPRDWRPEAPRARASGGRAAPQRLSA